MAKKEILIVEDDRIVAEDIKSSLENLGFSISAIVSSGAEAIAKVKEKNTDLVFMDILLKGGMDGIETLTHIREKTKEVPVVMVTGRKPDEDESCKKCEELGISGYIHKPLELDELERVVTSLLNK